MGTKHQCVHTFIKPFISPLIKEAMQQRKLFINIKREYMSPYIACFVKKNSSIAIHDISPPFCHNQKGTYKMKGRTSKTKQKKENHLDALAFFRRW